MKKILLATTILGMTAGFASAEIAFSGSATAGIASNGTANSGESDPNTSGQTDDTYSVYSSMKLSVAATAETDSGLTFGASTSVSVGETYAMADDDGFELQDGTFGDPTIFVSGSFGKETFDNDGLDF